MDNMFQTCANHAFLGTRESVLFVGRCQTGKTALINALAGVINDTDKPTNNIYWRYNNYIRYGESPDLTVANTEKRAKAARNIAQFLRECKHSCKLVFVCTLESGRVHPDDVTTIEVVLDAINDNTFPYSIIVNKTSARFKCDRDYSDRLLSIMSCGHTNPAEVFFYPYDEQLADADNVIVKPNDDFRNFMQRQKAGLVSQSRITELDDSKFTSFKHLQSALSASRVLNEGNPGIGNKEHTLLNPPAHNMACRSGLSHCNPRPTTRPTTA